MVEGIYIMNKVSQDLLLRPMGIFQLIDYVGIDVFYSILNIIGEYTTNENFSSDIINKMFDKKILGGQNPDGSQKDGFLKYERGRPAGVYDVTSAEYKMFDPDGWTGELDKKLGAYLDGFKPWKALLMDPVKGDKMAVFFKNLVAAKTIGAELATAYLKRSKEIGEKLVADKIANSAEDVNKVLTNGFYHLYGPINEYI